MRHTLTAHWAYLKYVLRHKRFVYQEGRKLGVGRIQLLVHNFQKFLPAEWTPYVHNFYGTEEQKAAAKAGPFDKAWLHHQKLGGKHHWQYWVLIQDDSSDILTIPMPDKYRREMLADWRGAGRAIHGTDETAEWYREKRDQIILHHETRTWIEDQLGVVD